MKATIDVKDRKEAEALRAAFADPVVRAFVLIMGLLKQLPTDRSRARVLEYVSDLLDEQDKLDPMRSSLGPGET